MYEHFSIPMLVNPKSYSIEEAHINIGNEKVEFSKSATNLGF